MRATTEPLDGNLVRLSVEIDEPEFDKALGDVVRTLARQVRVPGFRPGKVPRKVLEARMGGAGALRAEALRESLPDFYARAFTIAVEGGRAKPVGAVAPTLTLSLSSLDFVRLGCGRATAAQLEAAGGIGVTGDTATGQKVLGLMNFMF